MVKRVAVTLALLLAILALLYLPSLGAEGESDGYAYLPLIMRQPTPTASPTPDGYIPPDDLANEQEIQRLINKERVNYGLPPYTLVDALTQAARRHANDMADNDFTSHTGSDGSSGGDRMRDAGYDWLYWAEIIGWGFGGNPASMFDWWMNSPIHHDMILHPTLEDLGVGYAYNASSTYKHYWTVNFGRRAVRESAPAVLYLCTYFVQDERGGISAILVSADPCS